MRITEKIPPSKPVKMTYSTEEMPSSWNWDYWNRLIGMIWDSLKECNCLTFGALYLCLQTRPKLSVAFILSLGTNWIFWQLIRYWASAAWVHGWLCLSISWNFSLIRPSFQVWRMELPLYFMPLWVWRQCLSAMHSLVWQYFGKVEDFLIFPLAATHW